MLTVVGGKLTTYRAMAEETVDAVVARLGRGARRSLTARLPLVGAAPRSALARVDAPDRLVARYGTEAPVVAALGAEPVVEGRPETVGELRFAVRHEGARTVADLLDRRTRIGLVPADRVRAPSAGGRAGLGAAPSPARMLGRHSAMGRGSKIRHGHVHARARRAGPAVAPLADGGELGGLPAAARCGPGSTCSTSGAGRARSPSTWPRRVAPGRVLGIDVSDRAAGEARGLAERSGVDVTFEVGDVYALAAPDDAFDVVHAHQVLQHLTDPVAALREMARVCRPGGVIAVRDVDYAALTWFPADDGLDRWLDLYQRVHRHNGSRAGRRPAAAVVGARGRSARRHRHDESWCFASPADREWWGTSWAGRATASSFAEQAVSYGLATDDDLAEIAAAWLRWAAADDGWLGMLHGELLIRV